MTATIITKPRSGTRGGGAVSRVLFGRPFPCEPDGHLSRMAVARHLVRPTRGLSGPGRTSPPIWPCSSWGLPCHGLFPAVRWALTPPFHPFPPCGGWSVLCGPIRRLAAPRSYLAACPWSSDFPRRASIRAPRPSRPATSGHVNNTHGTAARQCRPQLRRGQWGSQARALRLTIVRRR
jgi:hypothetical protein